MNFWRNLTVFGAILVLVAGCSKAPVNKCTVSGHFEDASLNNNWVYLMPSLRDLNTVIDSAEIINNEFKLNNIQKADSSSAVLIVLTADKKPVMPLVGTNLVLEPGRIVINFDKKNVPSISGTPQNDMIQACDDAVSNFDSTCVHILDGTSTESIEHARNARNDSLFRFLKSNINSPTCLQFLSEYYIYFNKQQLSTLLDSLSPENKAMRQFKPVFASVNTAVGENFVNIKLPDLKGDSISLTDMVPEHDYVLVDFFASWCNPCMRMLPDLQAFYNTQNHKHFEILSVSLDNERERWQKVVTDKNITWPCVSDLLGWKSLAVSDYGIAYIPSTVLINRAGKIVSRNPSIEELKVILK